MEAVRDRPAAGTATDEPLRLYGLLAEFDGPGPLTSAAGKVRDAGYSRWDCYSPFPIHGLNQAMGLRDTRLPWVVLAAAIAGAATAVGMQWWMNAIDYPYLISGKPLFSLPANVPIIFELTVLFSALTAFGAMFAFNKLPQFYHPTFRSRRFKRATSDRFFIEVEAADPKFDEAKTTELLQSAGCVHLERLED